MEELGWEPSVDAARRRECGRRDPNRASPKLRTKGRGGEGGGSAKGVKAVAEEIEVKLPYDIKPWDRRRRIVLSSTLKQRRPQDLEMEK